MLAMMLLDSRYVYIVFVYEKIKTERYIMSLTCLQKSLLCCNIKSERAGTNQATATMML